jgi:hypothetical protein
MTASVPVIVNPSSAQSPLPPNPQIMPRIPSRHLENAPQLDPQQPLLSIDPLQPSSTVIPPPPTSAPQHLEAEEHQNLPKNSPQRSLRGTRTATTSTTTALPPTTKPLKQAASDPKTRAEATKEKNRRAQQRFRHKQKSRLELLECEVTRLRNLLRENGIEDPGSRVTDSTIEEEEIVPPPPPVRLVATAAAPVAGPSKPPKARSPSPDHPPDHPPVS